MGARLVVAATLMIIAVSFNWVTSSRARSSDATSAQTTSEQRDSGVSAESEKTERQQFMRGKLSMVNRIVEGLATEDFEMIKQGGMELAALTEAATWKSKDPYYRHYSANFEHAVKGLIDAAEAKSVEKATFAYMHVTISCTACHQHVRGTVRLAQ